MSGEQEPSHKWPLQGRPMFRHPAGPYERPQGHKVRTVAELDAAVDAAIAATASKDYEKIVGLVDASKRKLEPNVADMVNLPAHYARFKIEPMRYAAENSLNVFQFNINKYACRAPFKHADNGREDIRKVIRVAIMFYKFQDGNPDFWKAYSPEFIAALNKELAQ